jgi:hypothetical protein
MIALTPKQGFVFTPVSEMKLPENQRTSFEIKALTLEDENAIEEALYTGPIIEIKNDNNESFRVKSPTVNHQYCVAIKRAVVAVKNFKDSQGKDLEFEPTDSFLQLIPSIIRAEIGQAILAKMRMDEETVKN